MAATNEFRMSAARYEELKKELEYNKTTRADEVSEQIKIARGFGDLSENSEYDEAKTEQGKLYSKIAEIKNLIENAEIIEDSETTDKVGNGSVVTIRDVEFDEIETYKIVGSQEANPAAGKVSDDSPVGRALMGHGVGETVNVEAPGGTIAFEIIKIER